MKDLDQQDVRCDTSTMGCPFEVALSYRQPFDPSLVGQPEQVLPVRQPLLDWLSTLTLKLDQDQLSSVIGDTAKFTVPCIKLELKSET